MNASFLRTAVILLALTLVTLGDEQKRQPSKAGLITRVHQVPPSFFLSGSSGDPEKAKVGSNPKKLPPTRDGEDRYEVWERLVAMGVPAAPGSRAILMEKNRAVIVTASADAQDLVDRMFEMTWCGPFDQQIEIIALLLEYDEDPFANGGPQRRTLAELKTQVGDSLRVLDAFRIVDKSGQRTVGINKECATDANPAKPPASPAKDAVANETRFELNGARGSLLEIEPTIGPDGMTADMMLRYEARFKQSDGRPDAELKFTNNMTIAAGQDLIAYSTVVHDAPAVAKGKIKRRALIVSARIFHADNRTPEERRLAEEAFLRARDAELIRKATEGLGEAKQ